MLKRLKFIVATFVAALVLFAANRVVFMLYNHTSAAGCSTWELMQTLVYGLKLDSTTAGYITAIPLLVSLATVWLPRGVRIERLLTRILNIYFALIAIVIAIIQTADIGMFEAWQTRIDSQIFLYTPEEMLASVSLVNGIVAALYIIATVTIAIWLFGGVVRRWFIPTIQPREDSITRRVATTLGMLLLAGTLFVVIRGGVTTATANVSKAYFSPKMFLNQTAVNPIFSLLSSMSSTNDFEGYTFMDDAECEELFSRVVMGDIAETHPTDGATRDVWLTHKRPNIVLIIVEGMGRTITDAEEAGKAVTPSLNALKGDGVWFENLYASSFRTDRGTVATLSGFPAQPKISVMKYPTKAAQLPSIARSLANEGYATHFWYGGDANFTNTRAYLYATGFDDVTDQELLPNAGHLSKWGIADDTVIEHIADVILARNSDNEPTLDVVLTLSSHEPFEVPYSRLDNPMLNAFAFTDSVIGNFVERVRSSDKWQNTLIIIIPDHGYPYPATIGNNTPQRHHIPMLWIGGAARSGIVVDKYASQTDLAATLLAQMEIRHDDFLFSRDIARSTTPEFGYWSFNDGFGVIDSLGVTIYDHSTGTTLGTAAPNDTMRLIRGETMLQKTFIELKR